MERTPEIIFGGDTDVVELTERLSTYTGHSKRNVLINGILMCKNNFKTPEIFIPGNLRTKGIDGSKINLNVSGDLESTGEINICILKVRGKTICEKSINAYDITSKSELICNGILEAQFAIICNYLEMTKECYPAINVHSLRVNGDIYCNGPIEVEEIYTSGDVYYKGYMYFLKSQIMGKTIAVDK